MGAQEEEQEPAVKTGGGEWHEEGLGYTGISRLLSSCKRESTHIHYCDGRPIAGAKPEWAETYLTEQLEDSRQAFEA